MHFRGPFTDLLLAEANLHLFIVVDEIHFFSSDHKCILMKITQRLYYLEGVKMFSDIIDNSFKS